MATSRSHVKRRFTPYQSTANTFEAKIHRPRRDTTRLDKTAMEVLGQEHCFWSQLSDDALFSISQQACLMGQTSDDTIELPTNSSINEIAEAFARNCSVNRPPDELIETFSRQCSLQTTGPTTTTTTTRAHKVPSAPSPKTNSQFPLLKDIPELHGLSQLTIATRCYTEMADRRLSMLEETISAGDIERLRQIRLRRTTLNKHHKQVTDWIFECLQSMLPDSSRK
ncbi:hypothetical protein BGZ79_009402 [Entomortierella chlamydospora]|nr:hypothetical protein BGZ79_009402 [Entomortierella chlamydospora]